MQKLAKRTSQAQRQAARRLRQGMEAQTKIDRKRNAYALRDAMGEIRQSIKDARRARLEDWELGPLAPKRDLGFNNYGLVSQQSVRIDWHQSGRNRVPPKILEQRCAWAGGVKQLNLAAGDRVVILDSHDKGKIDRVEEVNPANGTVRLEKFHRALCTGVFGNGHSSQAMPLSIASIRLVYPICNPETGITRDVVINQLKAVPPNMKSDNMTLERWDYGKKWDRLVPGINVIIPWPEVKPPQHETMAADTTRTVVEERSFFYSLLAPPMPEPIIDELRNKYSRFRTRHEAWYLERKAVEQAAKEARRESVQLMQTPLQEFHEMRKALREAQGEPQLTDDMLEKIGEVMAKNKPTALAKVAGSEVVAEDAAAAAPPQPPAGQ